MATPAETVTTRAGVRLNQRASSHRQAAWHQKMLGRPGGRPCLLQSAVLRLRRSLEVRRPFHRNSFLEIQQTAMWVPRQSPDCCVSTFHKVKGKLGKWIPCRNMDNTKIGIKVNSSYQILKGLLMKDTHKKAHRKFSFFLHSWWYLSTHNKNGTTVDLHECRNISIFHVPFYTCLSSRDLFIFLLRVYPLLLI